MDNAQVKNEHHVDFSKRGEPYFSASESALPLTSFVREVEDAEGKYFEVVINVDKFTLNISVADALKLVEEVTKAVSKVQPSTVKIPGLGEQSV